MNQQAAVQVAKHSPGPWVYAYTRLGHTVRQSPDAMRALLVVNTSENPEADARLMATAPDLLAALQELIPMFAEWHSDFPEHVGDKEVPALQFARAAIAKATGAAA